MIPNGSTGASSGGYKVTVQNQVTAVDESIVTVVVFAVWRATSSAQTLHATVTDKHSTVCLLRLSLHIFKHQLLCALQRGKAPKLHNVVGNTEQMAKIHQVSGLRTLGTVFNRTCSIP